MTLDILIFAGLAIFLAFRLKDILGRSGGKDKLDHPFGTLRGPNGQANDDADDQDNFDPSKYDQSKYENNDDSNVVKMPGAKTPPPMERFHDNDDINKTIIDIRKIDQNFHPKTFIEGAEMAYEMVLNGYAAGDLEELRGLMSAQVFNDFKNSIDARVDAGETLETTLVGFDSVDITGVTLNNKTAEVDVVYTTQQVNIVRDSNGDMIDDEDAHVTTQQDRWTLVRKMTSKDPNWTLVSLATIED